MAGDLYHYRARYYDPIAGRFVSEDPITFGTGDANFYRYVQNNPVNNGDPSGLQTTAEDCRLLRLACRYACNAYEQPEKMPATYAVLINTMSV